MDLARDAELTRYKHEVELRPPSASSVRERTQNGIHLTSLQAFSAGNQSQNLSLSACTPDVI